MNTFVYAGFWKRFFALFIDILIIFVPVLAFNAAIPYIGGAIFNLLYRPIFDASPLGSSPGRAFMGLRVVNEAGERITLKQAYFRYFASFLSYFLFLGFFMSLFNSRRQTLHDMLAETLVIETEVPSVNFLKYWFDELSHFFDRFGRNESTSSTATSNDPAVEESSKPSMERATSADFKKAHEVTPAGSSAQEKLTTLKQMLDQGLISADDYERKKKEILENF